MLDDLTLAWTTRGNRSLAAESAVKRLQVERDAALALAADRMVDAGRYQWLESNPMIDIRYGYDAEDWPVTLYKVSGSINDREWSKLSCGDSLGAAIDAAIKATS